MTVAFKISCQCSGTSLSLEHHTQAPTAHLSLGCSCKAGYIRPGWGGRGRAGALDFRTPDKGFPERTIPLAPLESEGCDPNKMGDGTTQISVYTLF